ncbi:MAG: DNA polymerase ligase N-terminal domain-containing protein [Planctomycetota bacterium]
MSVANKNCIFVIHLHKGKVLHYDFRLEIDGVLKSWVVPKGPSLNPKNKRLSILTTDHNIEYAKFEGYIQEGYYGAGPVIIWDNGEVQYQDDPLKGFRNGKLNFKL